MSVQYFTVDSDRAGQRIDNFLSGLLKGVPRSLIYRIIRKGEVRVNKGRVKPDRKLQCGDVVRVPPIKLDVQAPPPKPSSDLRELLRERVLYDDDDLMAINKPAGMAVHGGSGISLGLIESLRQIYPEYPSLELVHRLDRETSGCLLVAKRRSSLVYLQRLFREESKCEGQLSKVYYALVQGRWPKRKCHLAAPLLKNELQSGERMVRVHVDGKASLTRFSLLKHYEEVSLIQATPVTGRTHQIRVHTKHSGYPIVADDKYGDADFNKKMRAYGFKRLCLHAFSIGFTLKDGTYITFEAPLPEDISVPLQNMK